MRSTTAVSASKYFISAVGPKEYLDINKLWVASKCTSVTIVPTSEIGGFDTTLFPWGQENVELSIRVWLCGENGCLRAWLWVFSWTALLNYSKFLILVFLQEFHLWCPFLSGLYLLISGGSVIRQPCSRVAHTYRHLYEGSARLTCNIHVTHFNRILIILS